MFNKNVETLHCNVSITIISIENYVKLFAGWVFIHSYGDVMYYVSTFTIQNSKFKIQNPSW